MHEHRQMALRPHPLYPLPIPDLRLTPARWHPRILGHRIHAQLNDVKRLAKPREHERRLVVCELLAEANARTGVEGEEDEGVGREVLRDAGVEETVWVVDVCVWTPEVWATVHSEDRVDNPVEGG